MLHRISIVFRALLIAAFVLAPLSSLSALAAPPPPDYKPMDVGPEVRQWEATPERIGNLESFDPAAEAAAAASIAGTTPLAQCTIDTKIWLSLDDARGQYILATFDKVAVGPLTEIWVQRNLAWPQGDPRTTPVIYCEQVQYLLSEFENNIYPIEIDFFGTPDFWDGTGALLPQLLGLPSDYYHDPAGRQVVLVSNIRDANYYDPTFPNYIAGFYSSAFETYFARNVMSIDAYDWANRVGPDVSRPHLYEGVFAHEYQHLLHDDYDSDEENFINEGMSDLAEFLVGYGHPDSHISSAASNPENSLVVWEDQGPREILTDYGLAYLFQLYLMEQYGQTFTQALFHNADNGISGVNSSLAAFGSTRDFAQVYHDYSVALVIDSKMNDGVYEFQNIDFQVNLGTPQNPNPEAFATPGAPPWGTDFIWVDGDPKTLGRLTFNGVDYATFPTDWTSDGSVLWGGTGDLVDNWAIFSTTGGGTLTFDTKFDIEAFWDFGFVQVSTDGGHTWTSLANAYTTTQTDPSAHPTVKANVPGLTGSTGGAWVNMSFDLSAYAGQQILVAFRYVTDWATTEAGWFVDNVYVDGNLISDGSDASIFLDITEVVPINQDFQVTFIGISDKTNGNPYKVLSLDLDQMTEDGVQELNALLKTSSRAVMLVTFEAPEGYTNYAPYTYDFTYTNEGPKK